MCNLCFVGLLLGSVSCGDMRDGPPPPDDTLCVRGTLEPDIEYAGDLAGPDVDADSGKLAPGSYIISSTYLKLATDPEGQQAFRDAVARIVEELSTQDGLSAFQLATSEQCLTARTLSVWRDEAAMYRFAAGAAHEDAKASLYITSRGGGVVTHWADDHTGATFEAAARRIADESGPFF